MSEKCPKQKLADFSRKAPSQKNLLRLKKMEVLMLFQFGTILDSHRERIILADLHHFRKLEVAESYARFFRDMFGQEQYKFRVIDLKK